MPRQEAGGMPYMRGRAEAGEGWTAASACPSYTQCLAHATMPLPACLYALPYMPVYRQCFLYMQTGEEDIPCLAGTGRPPTLCLPRLLLWMEKTLCQRQEKP